MREPSRDVSKPMPPQSPEIVEGARKIYSRTVGRKTAARAPAPAPATVSDAYQPRTRALAEMLGRARFRHDDAIFKRAYSTGLRDLCFLPGTERELGIENGFLFLMPWSAIAARGTKARSKRIQPLVIGELKDHEFDALHLILAALAYDPEDLEPLRIEIRKSAHAYIGEWMVALNEQSAHAPKRIKPDEFLQYDTPNAADDLRKLPAFFTVNIVETMKRLSGR